MEVAGHGGQLGGAVKGNVGHSDQHGETEEQSNISMFQVHISNLNTLVCYDANKIKPFK